MSFEYQISKAIDISVKKNAQGQDVIVLAFRYVNFELTLDDVEKRDYLVELLTGVVQKKEKKQEEVKMPRMYSQR